MPFDFRPVFQRALPYTPFLQAYGTPEHQARWQRVYDAISLTSEQRDILASFRRRMNVLCLSGPWCGDCVNACPIHQRIAEASPLIDLRFINRAQNTATTPIKPGTAEDPDDIRSRPIGKILVKWGIITSERVDKALLAQEERNSQGLNIRIGDVMTDMGFISAEQRDRALAAQSGFTSIDDWDRSVADELKICGGSRVPVLVFLSEDWHECERFGERTLATYREKARKMLANTQGASCPTGLVQPEATLQATIIAEWCAHFERVQWMLLTSPRLSALHANA